MSLIDVILDIIKEKGLLVTDSFVRCYKIGSNEISKNTNGNQRISENIVEWLPTSDHC